jgi:hypothetical protein
MSVAVIVTGWVHIDVSYGVNTTSSVAAAVLTVWVSVLDVRDEYVASPEYVTVMACAPAARELIVHNAVPTESVSDVQPAIAVPLSLNVTVPEGVPALPVSVAVKVTAWPEIDGLSVESTRSAGTAALTVWVKVVDVGR